MRTFSNRLSVPAFLVIAAALCAGCESQTKISRPTRDLPGPNVPASNGSAPTGSGPIGAAPSNNDTRPVESAEPVNKLSEAFTLKVTGMTCRFVCIREVVEALSAVPGVTNVIIDYDAYKAIVHCKVGTNPDDLLAALQATGKYSGLVLPK